MMKKCLHGFIVLTSMLSLSACLMTRDDVAEEEQKKTVQQQVSNLQKVHADEQSHFSEVNEEFRDLHGKIETLENKVQVQNKEREKTQNLADQQLAETNKKVAGLQEEVQKLENQVSFLNQELVKMSQAQAAGPVTPAVPDKARPGEKKSDSFKMGEDSFAKKDWRDAILQFQNYRKNFPKGKHTEMATYKIGLAFRELGMKDEAKTFFDEVISSYPDTALAKQAKDQLKKKRD